MTRTSDDLIPEILRLDKEIKSLCASKRYVAASSLQAVIGTYAPELARRLRDAEEKLARANEALCLVIGLAEEGVRSLRRSPSCHQEHICEDEETLARVRAIIAALKEPVT